VKILIIDDDKTLTSMLSKFFNFQGHPTVVINDPWDGLDRIQKEQFDVILLDICMPEFSGDQIIKTLATNEVLQDQNIFILSANLGSEFLIKDMLRKNGINGCLEKPIDPDELLTIISNKEKIPKII
jgi:DNA-binding response OmpR family regulator